MLSTPTALSPTSSAATSTCNPAGQRRVQWRQPRRSAARVGRKAISTRYLLRVDTGFLVRKRWEWIGFLAKWAVRA